MKRKGIGPVEQHIEKVVLAAVGVLFLVVLAAQILLSPNSVEINGQSYKPQDAFQPVEREADRINAQMTAASVDLPEVQRPDLPTLFDTAVAADVAPQMAIMAFGPDVTIEGSKVVHQNTGDDQGAIVQASMPAPGDVRVATYWATIDPYAAQAVPELADLLPKEQPYDKGVVVIQGTYDGTQVRQALLGDEKSGVRAMPPNWWRDTMAIFAVQAQRQQQMPDGSWSEPVLVPPMPGDVDMIARAGDARTFDNMAQIVQEAEKAAADIQRPAYYQTIAGPGWLTPSEAAQASTVHANEGEVRTLMDRRTRWVDQRTALAEDHPEQAPDEGDPARNQWERTQRQIESLTNRIAQVDEELTAMGVDPEVGLAASPEHDPTAFQPTEEFLLDADSLALWTNDMTAQPGATYRYRMRVVLNNPAFGRGDALAPDQRAMAAEPTLPGEWSQWSEPVHVGDLTQFFVTNASAGEPLEVRARATVDVFKFYYGYWRHATTTLEPGDAVVQDLDLPDPELLPIFDLSKATDEEGEQATETTEPKPGPTELLVALDIFLLGVAPVATVQRDGGLGGGQTRYEVFLGDPAGQVHVRLPQAEAASDLYQRLLASAQLGMRQGQPEPKPDQAPRRIPDKPDPFIIIPPGGGGGGGGSTGGGG